MIVTEKLKNFLETYKAWETHQRLYGEVAFEQGDMLWELYVAARDNYLGVYKAFPEIKRVARFFN